ncbi:pectate lyase [Emericellopsis atlantica]|uniref:Pectate lyase n=1 Tax=Emericellopsis atlantica TaxID=2614577 RepID=A0A9P7ZG39_9HYPO|nr:pectate lyase [Emericellopsis atlantica]KAG9251091.1 pectate lyase [Emericellopsis atlantica]
MSAFKIASILAAAPLALACVGQDAMPSSTGHESLSEPRYISPGEVFDAGFVTYDRGVACTGQSEGGEADTVFVLEEGATLRNVIIGANQGEGVYCLGSCTLENLWFEDVCEDAISIKGDGTADIIGGGAYHAADKVIQHNGCGHVNIYNFYAEDYGKVYRSCGNCSGNCARSVHMEGVTAVDGGELMGINPNLGDTATYSNNCFPKTECQAYVGCDKSNGACEPDKAGLC